MWHRWLNLLGWRPQRNPVPLALGALALGDWLFHSLSGSRADSGLLTFAGTMFGIWATLAKSARRSEARRKRGRRRER